MELKIIKVNSKDLHRAEYNPRIMSEQKMSALMTSIETKGFIVPMIVNMHPTRQGYIISGHQRLTALERLATRGIIPTGIEIAENGGYLIPAVIVEFDLLAEKESNLGMNNIEGDFIPKQVYDMIVDLKGSPTLPSTGFSEYDISRILDSQLPEEEDEETDEIEGEPRSKLGEIYELGQHRLICGDSTDPETYKKLLGPECADMVFTDPPYNVNYKSRGEKLNQEGNESIKNDNMDDAQFKEFIDAAFHALFTHTKEGASFYICSGWSSYPQFLQSMLQNGFQHSGVIIWVKNVPSMGWNDYRYKHEWIARAKKPDPKTAQSIIYGWKEGTHKFYGDNEYDVWEMPRKAVAHYLHPTEKPDWLAMRALRNSTQRNDIVLDPFGGSGSTMAAAEKVGRRAYMIELDPKFCDVIRNRWERINKIRQ